MEPRDHRARRGARFALVGTILLATLLGCLVALLIALLGRR